MANLESRVIEKLEQLDTRLDSIDRTLVKQEANLDEHMRRTEILEEELKPLKAHSHQIMGALKLGAGIISVGSFIAVVIKLIKQF